jgi:plasmid stabilization system protein ParE
VPKSIRIDPEASQEIASAIDRYEAARPGLGSEFLDEVDAAIASLAEPGPECGPAPGLPAELGARRKLIDRFPYSIVFVELEAVVRVIAVMHGHRLPAYWSRRLS